MIDRARAQYIQEMVAAALRDDGRIAARNVTRRLLLHNSVNEVMELSMQVPEEILAVYSGRGEKASGDVSLQRRRRVFDFCITSRCNLRRAKNSSSCLK